MKKIIPVLGFQISDFSDPGLPGKGGETFKIKIQKSSFGLCKTKRLLSLEESKITRPTNPVTGDDIYGTK